MARWVVPGCYPEGRTATASGSRGEGYDGWGKESVEPAGRVRRPAASRHVSVFAVVAVVF